MNLPNGNIGSFDEKFTVDNTDFDAVYDKNVDYTWKVSHATKKNYYKSFHKYTAKTYFSDEVYVVYETGIYELLNLTRPYISADFTAELADEDWGLLVDFTAGEAPDLTPFLTKLNGHNELKFAPTDATKWVGILDGEGKATLKSYIDATGEALAIIPTTGQQTIWDDKYTKLEVNNLISGAINNLIWKEDVATEADLVTTFPDAEEGWTSIVNDVNKIFRFDGTTWVSIGDASIPMATSLVDGKMSKENFIKLLGIAAEATKNTKATLEEQLAGINDVNYSTPLKVKAYVDVALETKLNRLSDTFVLTSISDTSEQNGLNLIEAYAQAKLLTPGGNALSAANRSAVICFPATYEVLDGDFVLDTEFVDLVGVGSRDSIRIISSGVAIRQTADDVKIENVFVQTEATDFTKAAYWPDSNLPNTKIQNVIFDHDAPSTKYAGMRRGIEYSGSYIDVESTGFSFGGGDSGLGQTVSGIASGTFIRCKSGNFSFGYGATGIASGYFKECEANGGFGEDIASGTFIDCISSGRGFGQRISSGTFIRCSADPGSAGVSFGMGTHGVTGIPGTASGYYEGINIAIEIPFADHTGYTEFDFTGRIVNSTISIYNPLGFMVGEGGRLENVKFIHTYDPNDITFGQTEYGVTEPVNTIRKNPWAATVPDVEIYNCLLPYGIKDDVNNIIINPNNSGKADTIEKTSVTASRSLEFEDFNGNNNILPISSVSAVVITIPLNSVTPLPLNIPLHIARDGAGTVEITGSGTFKARLNADSKMMIAARYDVVTIIQPSVDVWRVFGGLET